MVKIKYNKFQIKAGNQDLRINWYGTSLPKLDNFLQVYNFQGLSYH